ncbi:MAG: XdhC family protein [Rhodospirillales bacterium]
MKADEAKTPGEPTDVIGQLLRWVEDGRGAALAAVVDTWGASPSPVGSLLAVNDELAFVGSVSGGCVEGEVVTESQALIRDGGSKTLDYGIADEDAWQVGLACGGRVQVFVTGVTDPWRETLAALAEARGQKRPAALIVDLGGGDPALHVTGETPSGPAAADPGLAERLAAAIEADAGTQVEGPKGERLFVAVFNPPLRLLVVGAVHIAQALAPMAGAAGFEVVVIDPRGAWATAARFPGVTIDPRWPREALEALRPDRRTAVVSLSHDPKLDDPALIEALGSDAFYIGALGSRRTHAKRLKRLAADGVPAAALARIHAPVGLDIGAATPAEIAVSIVAEVVSELRRDLS